MRNQTSKQANTCLWRMGMWCIHQAGFSRLLVLTRCICLFGLGFGFFCYVCTEYASAGVGGCVVKGCGYPCQAVRTYGVQGMFWQGSLDYVHCQSTWFILDSILSYRGWLTCHLTFYLIRGWLDNGSLCHFKIMIKMTPFIYSVRSTHTRNTDCQRLSTLIDTSKLWIPFLLPVPLTYFLPSGYFPSM